MLIFRIEDTYLMQCWTFTTRWQRLLRLGLHRRHSRKNKQDFCPSHHVYTNICSRLHLFATEEPQLSLSTPISRLPPGSLCRLVRCCSQRRDEVQSEKRKKTRVDLSIRRVSPPSSSCLTGRGICGSPCNSSGRELERRRKRKECKSGHREVTCLPVSHVPTYKLNFDVGPSAGWVPLEEISAY